jgi:putative cell wall-binding protein
MIKLFTGRAGRSFAKSVSLLLTLMMMFLLLPAATLAGADSVRTAAEEPVTFSEPTIELKLPQEALAVGTNFEAELWVYNIEGVKSANMCFDPDVNAVFRDPADDSPITTGDSFAAAIKLEDGHDLTAADFVNTPVSMSRWQLRWDSPEGLSADEKGVKVATISLQMAQKGIPQFNWKQIATTECALYAGTGGSGPGGLYNTLSGPGGAKKLEKAITRVDTGQGEIENTAPARQSGVPAATTAETTADKAYELDLSPVFEDADSDELTYKVSVNGASYVAAAKNYSYKPSAEGTVTLVFKANDGTVDSADTYTVTLTVKKAEVLPVPEQIAVSLDGEQEGVYLYDGKIYCFTDLTEGNQIKLKADVFPEGSDPEVVWLSDASGVSINEDGLLTFNAADWNRTAHITVYSKQGGFYGVKCTIDCFKVVSTDAKIYVLPSDTLDFTMVDGVSVPESTCVFSDPIYTADLDWAVGDESVASVEVTPSMVFVSGVGPGTTEVTATAKFDDSFKYSLPVTVTEADGVPVEDVRVLYSYEEVSRKSLVEGNSIDFTVECDPWYTTDAVTVECEDPGIAAVELKDGWWFTLTGLATGTTDITVRVGEITKKLSITVLTDDGTPRFTTLFQGGEYPVYSSDGSYSYTTESIKFDHDINPDITDYKAALENKFINLQPRATWDTAKFDGDLEVYYADTDTTVQSTWQPGSYGNYFESKINLHEGENIVSFKLTSWEDPEISTTYTFTINRLAEVATEDSSINRIEIAPSERALMSGLKAHGAVEGSLLYQKDGAWTTVSTRDKSKVDGALSMEYYAFLGDDVQEITLEPEKANPLTQARIRLAGGQLVDAVDKLTLDSDGETVFKLETISGLNYDAYLESGTSDPWTADSVYTLHIVRIAANKAQIKEMKLKDVELLSQAAKFCTPQHPSFEINSAEVAGFTFPIPDHEMAVFYEGAENTAAMSFTMGEGLDVYFAADYYAELEDCVKLFPDSKGEYAVNLSAKSSAGSWGYNTIIVIRETDDYTLQATYNIPVYQVNADEAGKLDMPDTIVEYLPVASQYTNADNRLTGIYGLYPEKSLTGNGKWWSPISAGNFGGYITYYYEDAVTDDPNNPYGVDFIVYGNSNGGSGFSEPGNVLVSEDGNTWYTLAGSEHYDKNVEWNHTVTYSKNADGRSTDWADGSSAGTLDYTYPRQELYPLADFGDSLTLSGVTAMSGGGGPSDWGSGVPFLPAFGYADVRMNALNVSGTGENTTLSGESMNPYLPVYSVGSGIAPKTGEYYEYGGDNFDLAWAVDENGLPVQLDAVHYIRVQTASFIDGGAIGEKSTEVNAVTRAKAESALVGKTEAPRIFVDGTEIQLTDGQYIYDAALANGGEVEVEAGDASVYINNKRAAGRTFESAPEKGVVRIIVQEGEKEPFIAYLKVAEGQVTRIAGDNRYDTSAKTALDAYPEGAETVIIARGDDQGGFADALAAGCLAGVENAPILLTSTGSLPQEIEAAVKKLGAKKAYVLGGELAVSRAVADKLKSLGLEVERIQGDNRYATAAAIAAKGGQTDTAIVVSGFAPADSLVAGPLAFSNKYPILLVDKNSVPAETKKAIADLGIEKIIVVGGENAVSRAVYNELNAQERYAGQSRIETSLDVAEKAFAEAKDFSIVGYLKLADAVGAAVNGNPIIYVKDNISDVKDYLTGAAAANFTIFGGTLAVSDTVENDLKELLQ